MATAKPITQTDLDALREFARENGRTWKSALNSAWMNCTLSGTLHALRNSHGPTWLANFRLPNE